MTPSARLAIGTTAGVSLAQASLGVATLVNYVPLELAALHQAGSLVLLSSCTWMLRSSSFAAVAPAAAGAVGVVGPATLLGVASIGGAGLLLASDSTAPQRGGRG